MYELRRWRSSTRNSESEHDVAGLGPIERKTNKWLIGKLLNTLKYSLTKLATIDSCESGLATFLRRDNAGQIKIVKSWREIKPVPSQLIFRGALVIAHLLWDGIENGRWSQSRSHGINKPECVRESAVLFCKPGVLRKRRAIRSN